MRKIGYRIIKLCKHFVMRVGFKYKCAKTGKAWMKLYLISERAQRDPLFRFMSLAHLLDKEFLKDCYDRLNRNKAVGVDEVS